MTDLLARGREAGVIRSDVTATDFAPIMEMLSAVTDLGVPGLPVPAAPLHRAHPRGLRPSGEPLPGEPLTEERLLEVATSKAEHLWCTYRAPTPRDAGVWLTAGHDVES